ncbi:MAG: response regulator [Candidatus Desulfofervidaceae bacterium]|nr:response regulator [Candidatus Desulfofervidaceae bacterium]
MSDKKQNFQVLVVDDEKFVADTVGLMVSHAGYPYKVASSAQEALELLAKEDFALVITDIMMPEYDGLWLIEKALTFYPELAIVVLTGLASIDLAVKCLKNGAYDFLTKPVSYDVLEVTIEKVLEKRKLKLSLKHYQYHLEEMVKERTAQLEKAHEEIKSLQLELIYRLVLAAEYKDRTTANHLKRISHYSAIIAQNFGLSTQEVEEIFYAAPMHDVGKIGIPDKLLLKPEKLTPEEQEIMKQHTIIGARILGGSDYSLLQKAERIALTHHEKYDGTGYPQGLKGEEIPIEGRIVAIADVFDALTFPRPYKPAYRWEKAFDIIYKERGKHFDPKLIDVFLDAKEEISAIYQKYHDEE